MEENESILRDIQMEEVSAPLGLRLLSNGIDLVIEIILLVGIYNILPRAFTVEMLNLHPLMRYIIAFIIITLYRLACLMFSGKTIGMHATSLKYLYDGSEPLTSKQQVLAAAFSSSNFNIKFYKDQ